MNLTRCAVALLIAGSLSACDYIAIHSAPKKQPAAARTETALKADDVFWQTLHGGRYEDIPQALERVTAAYLENPNDAVSAAHTGWLHIWRLSERARLAT